MSISMDEEIHRSTQSNSHKTFPVRPRVLAVDANDICLRIVERMLRECQYEVVAVNLVSDALSILWERHGEFDMVLTEVCIPCMDGFAILAHIWHEFKLPVIVMSADAKHDVVLRCLKSGASFFFMKPLTINNIRSLWQLVFQKRSTEMVAMEHRGGSVSPENLSDKDTESVASVDIRNTRQRSKRKTRKTNQDKEKDEDDLTIQKKERLIWRVGLQDKFLKAINQIGSDKIVPKKILKLMNVPGLTRKNIASHLQKHLIRIKNGKVQSRSRKPRLPTSSQRNMKQPLLGTVSSPNLQNETNSSVYQMGSSLFNDISGGLERGTNTVPVHNFSTLSLHENDIQSVGSKEPSNNLNQVPRVNYTNNNYAGIQIISSGLVLGSIQMPTGNGTHRGYNMMDAIAAARKSPILEFNSLHSDYATQGLDSSSGFQNANQSPTMFTDEIQQPQVPSLSLPQKQTGIGTEGEFDSLFDLINNSPTVGDASLLQSFDESDFGDTLLNQVDHSSNQQQGFEAVIDPDINIDAYQFDENPSEI